MAVSEKLSIGGVLVEVTQYSGRKPYFTLKLGTLPPEAFYRPLTPITKGTLQQWLQKRGITLSVATLIANELGKKDFV